VITLYYYEELKYSEIAEVMGIGQSRVCQILTKAIRKLKSSLEDYMRG
ncbi:MAG: sigma-70 family RNA polymerase sigma factor, partial [Clostridiales bacterium]|nr:sigma-70 family RNA polymerase sigma factor [Clostridiales bacterium]